MGRVRDVTDAEAVAATIAATSTETMMGNVTFNGGRPATLCGGQYLQNTTRRRPVAALR